MSDTTDDMEYYASGLFGDVDSEMYDTLFGESIYEESRDPNIWVTKDSRRVSIWEMTEEHLLNTIQLFGRDNPRINALVVAATARGLFEEGQPSCYNLSDFKIKAEGGQ